MTTPEPIIARHTRTPALPACVTVEQISHFYDERQSLDAVDFEVAEGEIFGLLGPNGSGKTTLFRILATLLEPVSGKVSVLGHDTRAARRDVRARLGVVFQSPALDVKLTTAENLSHQGQLFGIGGAALSNRVDELLERFALTDRASDMVETLSGGLARRLDLARALLHQPSLLILDEPTTGLDPGARRQLWNQLLALREDDGVTIMVTTHIMSDAEHCDRIGVLSRGQLRALDSPEALRGTVGGDVVVVRGDEPETLAAAIRERFEIEATILDGAVRIERPNGHELIPRLAEALGSALDSVTLARPTLEDAYIHITGHRLDEEEE